MTPANPVAEDFDIVVLSVGLGIDDQAITLAEKLNVELNHYHFAKTGSFDPVQSSRPGIYVCGAVQGPKDIPTSVIDASAAAGKVGSLLSDARWTLTKTKDVARTHRCQRRTSQSRCICLLLRNQYRRVCRCTGGRGICQNPAECCLCRAKSVQLLPGHPGPDIRGN